VSRRDRDWLDDIRLTVPDETGSPAPGRPAGPPLPARWAAALAVVALVAAGGAGALLKQRRGQVRTVSTVRYLYPRGVDLTGCPRGDNCVPLEGPGSALADRLPAALRGATVQAESSLFDASTSRTIRTEQVLAVGRLTVTVTAQCVAGAPAVRDRDLPPVPGDGRATAAVVRAGRQPGCSVAVVADAPAGAALPLAAVRELAGDPDLQLSP